MEIDVEMRTTVILLLLVISITLSSPHITSTPSNTSYQRILVLLVKNRDAYILSTWLATISQNIIVMPVIDNYNIPHYGEVIDFREHDHGQLTKELLKISRDLYHKIGDTAIVVENMSDALLTAAYACYVKIPIIPRRLMDEETIVLLKRMGISHVIYTGEDNKFIKEIENYGFIINLKSALKILKDYNSRADSSRLIVTPLSDKFSYISPLYAALKKWKLILLDNRGIRKSLTPLLISLPEALIYIASPSYLSITSFSIKELYRALIESSGTRYLLTRVGMISAVDEQAVSVYILRLLLKMHTEKGSKKGLLVFMEGSLPLSLKIKEMMSKIYGFKCTVLYSEGSHGNITSVNLLSQFEEDYSIVYLNLHGNPMGMALNPQGPYVISAYSVQQEIAPSIIITLSCETLNFEMRLPSESLLALKLISMGALAYVGAAKIELVSGEVSTGYPELIIKMLLDGFTLGEAVRVVNNIRIGEMKRVEPWHRAYTILIGDPDLRISKRSRDECIVKVKGKSVIVEVLKETPILFVKFPSPIAPERLSSIKCERPNIFIRTFIVKEKGKYYMYMYITRLYTSMIGDFKKGVIIRIDLIEAPVLEHYIIVMLIISCLLLLAIFVLRRLEYRKHLSSKD